MKEVDEVNAFICGGKSKHLIVDNDLIVDNTLDDKNFDIHIGNKALKKFF